MGSPQQTDTFSCSNCCLSGPLVYVLLTKQKPEETDDNIDYMEQEDLVKRDEYVYFQI